MIKLSAYNGEPPGDGKARKIAGGPLDDLAKIEALTMLPDAVKLWTARAGRDVANLAMDLDDVGDMIRELTERNYHSSEWCCNGKSYAACDAYTLKRSEYIEHAGKRFPMEYFVKFAESKTGKLVLIVSCHTSN